MREDNSHPKANLLRGAYSILFLIIERIVSMVIVLVVIVQFIHSLTLGTPHEKLLHFNSALSEYVKALISYVGFNTDSKPWPMGDWPSN